MLALELLAERKIQDAIARGEFDDLPGAGRPLDLDDDRLVPEDARAAYRMLRNAGYVPPEVQTLKQIAELECFIGRADTDDIARVRALKKLALLRTRIETAYYAKALRRLSR